MPQGENDLV
jgi:hypothetical protein